MEEEKEITHHHQQQQHSLSSSNNKLEEPTTTPPPPLVVEEDVVVTDVDPVAEMEKILNYRFRNKNLLNEALAQCSNPKNNRCSDASLERTQFQRLEFLGDAVLGLAVASFINFPNFNSNYFEIYKQNTSNEKFACVAIQHGFYRFIRRRLDHQENTKIINFALVLQEALNGVLSREDIKTPKCLADLVESIAAAIYVDCDFDLKLFWKCFGGLLEACVTPASLYLPEVLKLLCHCKKAGKQAYVRYWRQGSLNIAAVYVNGHFVCSSYSEEECIAKVNAATEALKLLSSTSDDHNWKFNTQKKKNKNKRVVEGNHVEQTEEASPICFKLRVAKEDSEDKAIKEKLEKKRNQLVETKKRKRETVSEVSAEKVERDMAIDEKLEKKSNKLVGTKKRKMENVSAEKVEQLFAEENSSMKNITCQSNIRENSKKYAPIYTGKHMDTSLSLVAEVEEILGYRFRNKSLLEEALTHTSYSSSTLNYERLEFVGDKVLNLALSNFIFINYPDLKPHQLSHLRRANINPEKLARVAIRFGFYRYIRCNSAGLDTMVRDFALVVQEVGDGVADGGVVKPPFILVAIVRSIAGAIFVDCEFDFKLLWKYFCGLLEPFVTLDTFQQQPTDMLSVICRKEGKNIDVKCSYNGSQHTVSYNVNGQLVGSGCSKYKFVAKIIAAREALKLWNLDSPYMHAIMGFGAKQKLNELRIKNGWKRPTYTIEKEGTPPDIKYTCKVQIETGPGLYLTATGRSSGAKASSLKSAALMMLHDLEKSEHGLVKSP